jgi:hypothetical protein
MRKLTIEAASSESARHILDALASFDPELLDDGGGVPSVAVAIRDDRQLIQILNAIEQHITARSQGAAVLDLGGRKYQMDAAPAPAAG